MSIEGELHRKVDGPARFGQRAGMEEQIKDAWLWLGKEITEFGFRWLVVAIVSGGLAVLGALIFGRGYKRRIKALEDQARSSGINQTFNFNFGSNADEYDRQLREAIEAKTTQNLRETIRRLPQTPLGDGHTYARLPGGTNIVTMADGTMRLALPVELSANFEGNILGSLSVTVEKIPAPKGEGRE